MDKLQSIKGSVRRVYDTSITIFTGMLSTTVSRYWRCWDGLMRGTRL
ncbi:MAG: hypothetical protein QXD24_01990 [Candidatus Caldarchaeum sp.]